MPRYALALLLLATLLALACAPREAPTPTQPRAGTTASPQPGGATPSPTATATPEVGLAPFPETWVANRPKLFTPGEIRRGGSFTAEFDGDPPHFDPDLTTSYYMLGAIGPVHNRLLRAKLGVEMNPYSPELVPDLAERWDVLDGGLRYVFHLRRGVRWQESPLYDVPGVEGRELTCADVAFNFQRMKTKGTTARGFLVTAVDTFSCTGDATFEVRLSEPDPGFLPNLGSVYAMIVAPEAVEKDGDLKNLALGTGPFLLKEFKPKTSLTYERNPSYYEAGVPYLDEYRVVIIPEESSALAAFRGGQLEYYRTNSVEIIQSVRQTEPSTVIHGLQLPSSSFHVAFNLTKEPWSNPDVRRAVSLAMNRQEMNDLVYDGQGATLALGIPWSAAFDQRPGPDAFGPYYQYDPARARELLARAGYPNGIPGTFEFVYYPYGDDRVQQSEMIQQYLAAIGINVSVQRLDYGVWTQQFLGQQWKDLALGFTVPAGGMALGNDWTYELMRCGGTKNTWRICDPALDQVLQQTRSETDPAKLKQLFRQVWDLETDQVYRAYVPQETRYVFWRPWIRNAIGNSGYRWDANTYGSFHVAYVWRDDPAKYR